MQTGDFGGKALGISVGRKGLGDGDRRVLSSYSRAGPVDQRHLLTVSAGPQTEIKETFQGRDSPGGEDRAKKHWRANLTCKDSPLEATFLGTASER